MGLPRSQVDRNARLNPFADACLQTFLVKLGRQLTGSLSALLFVHLLHFFVLLSIALFALFVCHFGEAFVAASFVYDCHEDSLADPVDKVCHFHAFSVHLHLGPLITWALIDWVHQFECEFVRLKESAQVV